MATGDNKKKRSTSGEESQTVTTEGGLTVDANTGEVLEEDFDIFLEVQDSYDDSNQGGGFGGDLQESYDEEWYQDVAFDSSQVKPGRSKD